MDNNPSQLELLPNETFIEIFQYFDIKQLFQTFDNLNSRFNKLIRSLNNLIFKVYDNYIPKDNFIPYIDNLIIHCQDYLSFKCFTNIRHLNLIQLTGYSLEQLDSKTLPYLEDLSVKNINGNSSDILYTKIFSNIFSGLKSSYISQDSEIQTNLKFEYLPVLCKLQIDIINLHIYETILSVCPNLNLFKFRLKPSKSDGDIKLHFNLKRMIIKSEDYIQSRNDNAINHCLSFVPNLERLKIHQDFFQIYIPYDLNSDWYASSIDHYLPLLRRFNYDLRVWYLTGMDPQIINTVDEMKRNFQNVHKDQYQSQS
jgi:hypothetical protein